MSAVVSAYTGAELPTQQQVASALFEQRNQKTFFGPIGFKQCSEAELEQKEVACGSNELKPMVTTQVQDGAIKVVAPLDQADAQLLYPAPIAAEEEEAADDETASGASYLGPALVLQVLLFASARLETELNAK